MNIVLIYPPMVVVSAFEFGFLFRLNQVLQGQDETVVELDPYKLEGTESFVYGSIEMLMIDALFFGFFMLITLTEFSVFDWLCCRKEVRALDRREIDEGSSDITAEKKVVQNTLKELDSSGNDNQNMVVVQNLQSFHWMMKRDVQGIIANDNVMVVGEHEIGVFSVKGISFSVKENEKFVILGSNNSGTTAVLESLIGLKTPVAGQVVVNKLQSKNKQVSYNSLHGIVGY